MTQKWILHQKFHLIFKSISFRTKLYGNERMIVICFTSFLSFTCSMLHTRFYMVLSVSNFSVCFPKKEMFDQVAQFGVPSVDFTIWWRDDSLGGSTFLKKVLTSFCVDKILLTF